MDNSSEEIRCKVAFWYFRRMALIVVLMVAGGLWFFYDGKVAWPKKNVVALAKEAFDAGKNGGSWEKYTSEAPNFVDAGLEDEEAIALVKEAHAEGGKPMLWEEFVISAVGKSALEVADESKLKAAFAAGAAPGASWDGYAAASGLPLDKVAAEADAAVGVDGFVAIKGAFDGATGKRDWATFGVNSGRKGWGAKEPKYHSKSEIKGQFVFAYALWGIGAALLVWALINSRRVLTADSDSFTTETGTRVPFADVRRVDKRKWDNKGLAYVYHQQGSGGEKRAPIDDLKYQGADKVLDRILERFEGDLVERIPVDSADEGGAESRDEDIEDEDL